MRFFTAILALFILNSCTSKQEISLENKLLFTVEKRDIAKDEITEFRFFDTGLRSQLITHSSTKQEDLNSNKLSSLPKADLEKILSLQAKLEKLDYQNSFPWKEDFYKRGDVYKVIISKEIAGIKTPTTYYFYSGQDDNPKVFDEIKELI